MGFGSFIAAFSIKIFFIPNDLIDGGTVGLAMIIGQLVGTAWIPLLIPLFSIPFVILAARHIGWSFVLHVIASVALFSFFLLIMATMCSTPFKGDSIEVVVIGGGMLGVGLGMILRAGGCLDGTEVLGLIINKQYGFTVGQVVFFCNLFVFGMAGIVFQDWHPPLMSLITYVVVARALDFVIVGLDETKAVIVISSKFKEIEESIMHDLGLGLTVMYGRGGFSKESREILYIIIERLQLSELKELIYGIDPSAFIAIENLHEVSSGRHRGKPFHQAPKHKKIAAQVH